MMSQITENTMQLLSSILDMAHGALPESDFALTMVVRCKHDDIPAHFLIGDDPEWVVRHTLEEIGKAPVIVGKTSADRTLCGPIQVGVDPASPSGDHAAEVLVDASEQPSKIVHMQLFDPAPPKEEDE
jgi:hypothetical protein